MVELFDLQNVNSEVYPTIEIEVIRKVIEISVQYMAGNIVIFFDSIFLTHGEVGEFVRSSKIVGLETLVAVFFRPDPTQGWSLLSELVQMREKEWIITHFLEQHKLCLG